MLFVLVSSNLFNLFLNFILLLINHHCSLLHHHNHFEHPVFQCLIAVILHLTFRFVPCSMLLLISECQLIPMVLCLVYSFLFLVFINFDLLNLRINYLFFLLSCFILFYFLSRLLIS